MGLLINAGFFSSFQLVHRNCFYFVFFLESAFANFDETKEVFMCHIWSKWLQRGGLYLHIKWLWIMDLVLKARFLDEVRDRWQLDYFKFPLKMRNRASVFFGVETSKNGILQADVLFFMIDDLLYKVSRIFHLCFQLFCIITHRMVFYQVLSELRCNLPIEFCWI